MASLSSTASYVVGSNLPDVNLWWFDSDDSLIDFSSGYTFAVDITKADGTSALATKTAGMAGAAGSGDGRASSDVPNLTIAWANGEIDSLSSGSYVVTVTATAGDGRKRKGTFHLVIK